MYPYYSQVTGLSEIDIAGIQQLYAAAESDAHPPETVSVTTSSGSGSAQTFQFTYSDEDGYEQMGWTYALIQTWLNQSSAGYLQYNHSRNTLWLRNDAGTSWTGPLSLGSAGTLQNSQCIVDGGASSAVGGISTLTINLAITFKPDFIGMKRIYMYAADTTG